MIWAEELAAALDQGTGVVVFHNTDASRTQQLALALADRAATLVETNEKALDAKQGNASGAWGDRGAEAKGEKRGEQTGERKGRSERARGAARGAFVIIFIITSCDVGLRKDTNPGFDLIGGTRGGRGGRFAQGLGNRMPASSTTRAR